MDMCCLVGHWMLRGQIMKIILGLRIDRVDTVQLSSVFPRGATPEPEPMVCIYKVESEGSGFPPVLDFVFQFASGIDVFRLLGMWHTCCQLFEPGLVHAEAGFPGSVFSGRFRFPGSSQPRTNPQSGGRTGFSLHNAHV